MKIQITLYDKKRIIQLTRHVVSVPKKEWQAMDFLEQGDYCKQIMEKSLYLHWRELEKDEA